LVDFQELPTLRHFVEELDQLKTKLLEMSSLVEAAIQRSISAVTQKDRTAADEVFRNEARINAIEVEIDEFAINLLALHQPMAADLRLIVAALKINTDLERMGDLSVNIAQRAISLIEEPVIKPMIDIPHIAGLVQSMVRKSLDAFVTRDADLARSVLASDDAVDSLRTASYHELVSFMERDPENIKAALDLLAITRNLERLADHSTNIAEDVLFLVKGIDVRHHAEARQ
jgi:phosphate transport system protein